MYEPAEVFFLSDNHTPFADSQVKDYVVNGARPNLANGGDIKPGFSKGAHDRKVATFIRKEHSLTTR